MPPAFGTGPQTQVVLYSTMDPWWATRVCWLFRRLVMTGWRCSMVVLTHERHKIFWGETGRAHPRAPGHFAARTRPEGIADGEEVLATIGDGQISARMPSPFAGINGNTYGRPGQVPGSENAPTASLIDPHSKTDLH